MLDKQFCVLEVYDDIFVIKHSIQSINYLNILLTCSYFVVLPKYNVYCGSLGSLTNRKCKIVKTVLLA